MKIAPIFFWEILCRDFFFSQKLKDEHDGETILFKNNLLDLPWIKAIKPFYQVIFSKNSNLAKKATTRAVHFHQDKSIPSYEYIQIELEKAFERINKYFPEYQKSHFSRSINSVKEQREDLKI